MSTGDFPGGRRHGHWIVAELPEFEIDPTSVGGDLPPARFSRVQFRQTFEWATDSVVPDRPHLGRRCRLGPGPRALPDPWHGRLRRVPRHTRLFQGRGLDDNAYANVTAACVLCRVLDLAAALPAPRRQELFERVGLDPAEF